jgi:hypothetical protein
MTLRYMGVQKYRQHTPVTRFSYRALYFKPGGPFALPKATRFYDSPAEARLAYLKIKRAEGAVHG